MKRFFTILASMAATLLLGTSCVFNWGINVDSHGSVGHTRYPNEFVLSESSAQCWGYLYNEKTLSYTLKLSAGRYGVSGDFVGEGVELAIELLGQPNEKLLITPGNYNISHNAFVPMVFLDGYEEDGMIYPSYIYIKRKDNTTQTLRVIDGTLNIAYRNNGDMCLKAKLRGDDNRYYTFCFEGYVRVEDHTGENPGGGGSQGGGDVTGDGKLSFVAGATYYGKQFSDDTDNYSLTLAKGQYADNGDFVDQGIELAIDFLCKPSSKIELQSGTYSCTYNDYAPMRFLEGFEDEDGTTWPTYIYIQHDAKGNFELLQVTNGTITVNKSGTDYSINATLYTVTGSTTRKFIFTYDGPINFVDGRSKASPATKSGVRGGIAEKGRKSPRSYNSFLTRPKVL